MTTSLDYLQVQQARDAGIRSAIAKDETKKQNRKLASEMAAMAAATMTLAQMSARRARIDIDGNGVVNINDFNGYANESNEVIRWQNTTRPPTIASVDHDPATGKVSINYSHGVDPLTISSLILWRNGTSLGPTSASNVATDQPGPGTWTYQLQVITAEWEGPLSAPGPVVTIVGTQPPVAGWTDLTPPAGAVVVYVANSGSDSNAGTQAAPFQTIQKGLSMLRNGQPDQCLLKCGDTWTLNDQITLTKSANSATKYMVLGSYGTGPRPKVRTPSHGIFGGNNSGQHNGFAIVGLDLAPIAMTGGSDGIIFLSTNGNAWDDVLVEDCYIHGYSAGIVMQVLVDGQVFKNAKVRRSIIVDNDNNGGGHAQGIFFGGSASWLIEECVIDNNARSKNDMFCHNLYCHELSGPGTFRGNISSRACSHGGQQRPGGLAEENLFLGCPINFYQGGNSQVYGDTVCTFRNNGCVDSRNINGIDIRGLGYVLAGAPGSKCLSNYAAHQKSGTGNVTAFDFDGFNGQVRGNAVYDWTYGGNGWGEAFQFEPNSTCSAFTNNRGFMPTAGKCVSGLKAGTSVAGNTFWTINPVGGYPQFTWSTGSGSFPQFASAFSDTSSTFINPGTIDVSPAAYLTAMGVSPGADPVATFLNLARGNSKVNWDVRWTAAAYNAWARPRIGISQAV